MSKSKGIRCNTPSGKDIVRSKSKGNNTMFSLAKANPSKTYNELRTFVERRSKS